MATASRRQGVRATYHRYAGRALLTVSAVSSGGLGWSAAHLVTSRLLAHQHEAAHGVTAGTDHVHASDLAAVVVALALTAASLLAVICAAVVSGGRLPVPRKRRLATARTAGLWSTGAFLAAETAAWAASDTHVVPPPVVLLIGLAVHGVAGVVAALLWRGAIERVCLAAAATAPRTLVRPVAMRVVLRGDVGGGSVWSMLRVAGRAPPALGMPA